MEDLSSEYATSSWKTRLLIGQIQLTKAPHSRTSNFSVGERMFPEESDKIERYVGGLPDMIHGNIVASKPKTMQEAIEMATELMDKRVSTMAERQAENKRKFESTSRNDQQQQQNKRQNTGRAYTAGSGDKKPYGGSRPLCSKCNYHHDGPCAPKCYKCNKYGHIARDCRDTGNANHINNQKGTGSGFRKPLWANPDNVVAGTFLLNNRYAYILFDTGADRSFVSTAFSSQIDITPSTLDHYYDVELADGRIIGLNTILKGCTLNFLNHQFNINLMPVELGSFDAIISYGLLKYMEKGFPIFLAHVTTKEIEDKSEKKRLEDVPIVQDFPEVFPEDLPGLPPTRQVEFPKLNFGTWCCTCSTGPYRLAPSEMKELSGATERSYPTKAFIRPVLALELLSCLSRRRTVLPELQGSSVYSKIDTKSGYHPIMSGSRRRHSETASELVKAITHFTKLICHLPNVHWDVPQYRSLDTGALMSEEFIEDPVPDRNPLRVRALVLMQIEKVISYASQPIEDSAKNYMTHDLATLCSGVRILNDLENIIYMRTKYLKCSNRSAKTKRTLRERRLGGMLIENAKFPEAIKRTKVEPVPDGTYPQWHSWLPCLLHLRTVNRHESP
ncbi:putative reverse transcriptase domain-containing protein [Tanacetum coccineum]